VEPPPWFCCLSLMERAALAALAVALPATAYAGVPLLFFDALWLLDSRSAAARRAAFMSIFGLEIVTIDESTTPIDVVRPSDVPLWISFAVWAVLPGVECEGGCGYRRFP
jgi:hypothetical protein